MSRPIEYGCIGIGLNPREIGWAYIDDRGNLSKSGKFPMQMGLPHGKQDAQIVDAILQLAELATAFACLIVCESLDFTGKKALLREKSAKYTRMLSSWAPSGFYQLLESMLSNRGISLFSRNRCLHQFNWTG